jgi:hypothetical protein
MRFVALLVVVAIIYVAYTRRGPVSSTAEAMKEADAVGQTTKPNPPTYYPPAAQQPAPQSSGLRAPIDRTHAVLDQVKQRAAEPF